MAYQNSWYAGYGLITVLFLISDRAVSIYNRCLLLLLHKFFRAELTFLDSTNKFIDFINISGFNYAIYLQKFLYMTDCRIWAQFYLK